MENNKITQNKNTEISSFLVGKKIPNISSKKIDRNKKNKYFNDLMNDNSNENDPNGINKESGSKKENVVSKAEEPFPDLGYNKVEKINYCKAPTKLNNDDIFNIKEKKEELSYDKNRKKVPNFIEVQDSLSFLNKVDGYLKQYDTNRRNRAELCSKEYKEKNIIPFQAKMKEELNGKKYIERRKRMQPSIHDTPKNIDSIVINENFKADRTAQRMKIKKEEDIMDMQITERTQECKSNDMGNTIRDNQSNKSGYRVTCDFEAIKVSFDNRFYQKGAKFFPQKYQSKVGEYVSEIINK